MNPRKIGMMFTEETSQQSGSFPIYLFYFKMKSFEGSTSGFTPTTVAAVSRDDVKLRSRENDVKMKILRNKRLRSRDPLSLLKIIYGKNERKSSCFSVVPEFDYEQPIFCASCSRMSASL